MTNRRPVIVTRLAIIQFLAAFLMLLTGFFFVYAAFAFSMLAGNTAVAELGAPLFIVGILLIPLSVPSFIIGICILSFKAWCWNLAIAFSIGNFLVNLYGLFLSQKYLVLTGGWGSMLVFTWIVSLGISGLVLYNLLTPRVKQAFGKA